jgi:hypothetical protein
MIREEARLHSATQRDAAFYRLIDTAQRAESLSPLRHLQDSIAQLQDRVNPLNSISKALEMTALADRAQQAERAIAELMRRAEPMREIERSIAELRLRADPAAELHKALEPAQAYDPVGGAVAAAMRLQQPLVDLERQLNSIKSCSAPDINYGEVNALTNAVRGITTILGYAKPAFGGLEASFGSAATAEEQPGYEKEAADLFDSAFNGSEGVLDVETFERGVERIVDAVRSIKDDPRRQTLLSQFIVQFLANLLAMFLYTGIHGCH